MRPHWDRGNSQTAELEALQTDVMRFIAILGLCLAAIFSLVNGAQQAVQPAAVADGAQVVVPVPPATEERMPLKVAQKSHEDAVNQRQQRDPQPLPHPAAETEVDDIAMTRPAPGLQQPVADLAPHQDTVKPRTTEQAAEVPATEAPVTDLANEPPAPAGFSLEFESGAALESLLATRQVTLYALVDNEYWVYRSGDRLRASDAPDSYYRMQPGTVPAPILGLANGLFPGAAIQWGVTLPGETLRDIDRLISSHQGGSLLIAADAGVRLE